MSRLSRVPLIVPSLGLLSAGFLWNVEEAVHGKGLHLVVLWLTLALLAAVRSWQDRYTEPPRRIGWNFADAGLLLIVIGHVVSTAAVFQIGGDRRAAVNLTMEWFGLFAAWRLLRQVITDRMSAGSLAMVIAAMATGLAAFGIWQHHVFYPENADWYRTQRAQLDQSLLNGAGAEFSKVASIVAEFQSAGIPFDGPERVLWENRLLSSNEPFATFALANTLAGVLAVAFVLLVGQCRSLWFERRRMSKAAWCGLLLQGAIVGWCLILTKSRSAWMGAVCGLTLFVVMQAAAGKGLRLVRWGMGAACAGLAVMLAAAWLGAIDKEVILESPKSLQFRLLYWTGTLHLLKDEPWVGAGPGNFRQAYLPVKSAESSEEIRDPHNVVLDAWSSGGLTALAGLVLFVGSVIRAGTQRDRIVPVEYDGMATVSDRGRPASLWEPGHIVAVSLLLGFAIHACWEWITGTLFDLADAPKLLLLTGVVVAILRGNAAVIPVSSDVALAGVVAMLIHLLAAGGFQMPTVMLLVLTMAAVVLQKCHRGTLPADVRRPSFPLAATAAVLIMGLAGIVQFGLMPVSRSELHIQLGDDLWYRQQMPAAAESHYLEAASADPLSVLPRQRLAELATYKLREFCATRVTSTVSDRAKRVLDAVWDDERKRLLERAVAACQDLINADRRNVGAYKLRAQAYTLAVVPGNGEFDTEVLSKAIADQNLVTQMHPTSVREWAELVRLSQIADGSQRSNRSESAARRALELEAVNQAWGHRDQFLPPDVLNQMRQVATE